MRPVDVVCLQGARLMSLAGGRRKRDIKFGFSICENSGTVRFFLLPNGPEFETWIKELQKAIDTYTTTEFMKSNNNPAREDFSLGISAEDDVAESKNSQETPNIQGEAEGYGSQHSQQGRNSSSISS